MLLCSHGIQAVSLGSFVQGIVVPSCFGGKTRGAKTGQRWDFLGLDSVGLYWLEFSGYSFKTMKKMEHIEVQQNYQKVF